jgi:hypothetical protein
VSGASPHALGEDEVRASLHRQGRYAAAPLLRELLAEALALA